MQFLIKISKLIPKLGTDNENEKLATLLMIEKLLKLNQLSWTDVGQSLSTFVVETLGFIEEEKLTPPASPKEEKVSGWSNMTMPPRPQPSPVGGGASSHWQQAPRPASPPPQPPPRPPQPGPNYTWNYAHSRWEPGVDPRSKGTDSEKLACVRDMLAKPVWINSKEKNFLLTVEALLTVPLLLTKKQQTTFEEMSKRL